MAYVPLVRHLPWYDREIRAGHWHFLPPVRYTGQQPDRWDCGDGAHWSRCRRTRLAGEQRHLANNGFRPQFVHDRLPPSGCLTRTPRRPRVSTYMLLPGSPCRKRMLPGSRWTYSSSA